jgi:hypothetical protein
MRNKSRLEKGPKFGRPKVKESNMARGTGTPSERSTLVTKNPFKSVDAEMEMTLPDFEVKGRSARYKDVRRGRATAMEEGRARYRRSLK